MGYQPDSIARSLQSGRTKTIGVIVPEIKHDFFASVLDGIEDVAYSVGYNVFVCKSNEDYLREVSNTKNLLSYSVSGIIVSLSQNTKDESHFKATQARNVPLVFFDRVSESIAVNKVVVNDEQGAFCAVEHLIQSGHKHIAYLAGPEHLFISKKRLQGYQRAHKQYNLPFNDKYVIYGGLDENDGIIGLQQLMQLQPRPNAVFCINDPVAVGVFIACKKKQLHIPGDMAIVGFSDNPIATLIDPPLTTVSQPAYEMGTCAAKLLFKELDSKNKGYTPKTIKLDTELIIRKST